MTADAATPAASVPAADILALADEWENYDAEGYAAGDGPDWWTRTDQLRALVAAAEQADKGEAADTPREQTIAEFQAECEHERWDIDKRKSGAWRCRNCGVRREPVLTKPDTPARVPVNDEAEAELWLIRNSKTGKWFMGSVGGDDGIWAKNIAMSVVYTSSESGPVYGLPEDGEWVRFRAARQEDA